MNQAIDYGQMAQLLMMAPQLVGDIIPFQRRPQRGEVPSLPHEGPAVRGMYGSKWRDPRFVEQEAANRGLRPGSLTPASPRTGDVVAYPTGLQPLQTPATRMGAPRAYTPMGRVNRDMDLVEQQWHHNTPNMNKALEKLTPAEINKLFDALFKAPPGVEFP